jgi:hypothetical protein
LLVVVADIENREVTQQQKQQQINDNQYIIIAQKPFASDLVSHYSSQEQTGR